MKGMCFLIVDLLQLATIQRYKYIGILLEQLSRRYRTYCALNLSKEEIEYFKLLGVGVYCDPEGWMLSIKDEGDIPGWRRL